MVCGKRGIKEEIEATSIQNFRKMIQKFRFPTSKMWVMDEVGIWSDDITPYTYGEKGCRCCSTR